MSLPKTSSIGDVFLRDDFGFFGFGDGGFGGTDRLLNPQWTTNSGSYGFDVVQLMSYAEASDSPSYVGASSYDLENSYFFAKITPPVSTSGIQTGILIKDNLHNYVEMSYGPNGQFNAYVSDNSNVTIAQMPTYDPTAHAYWRIRNQNSVTLFFDTSPNGITWTQQGSVPYLWDASSVTVTFFSGFTGLESSGIRSYISSVNTSNNGLILTGSANGISAVAGNAVVTNPNELSGRVNGTGNLKSSFTATLGIPDGGLTDFVYTTLRTIDPQMFTSWKPGVATNLSAANPLTQATWTRVFNPSTYPAPYRDGSYWQPAAYASFEHSIGLSASNVSAASTNFQIEKTPGLNNRLSLDASIYDTLCAYSPGRGTLSSVMRSTEHPLTGQYSGKMISNTSPATIGDGTLAYLPLPQSGALIPVQQSGGVAESLFGVVYLSTARASTTWFASLVFFDANYVILSATTYNQATITNKNTHPGGGVWQPGTVLATSVPNTAVWAAVVPVVNVSSGIVETTYMSNHTITGASLSISEAPADYSDPRTAQVNVKADRVNYVLNSGFNTGTSEWFVGTIGTSGSPNPATMAWDNTVGYKSAGSMRVDFAALSGTFTGGSNARVGVSTTANFGASGRIPIIQGLKIGHTYTITAWIRQGTNCPDVYMDFKDSNVLGLDAISTNTTKITDPENIDGNWTRIQTTYTVPPNGLTEYYMYFYVKFPDLAHAPFSFWVDSLMVEEATNYQGYFDGGFASADYKWESGGTANLSRSYFYKDYNNKFLRLNRALSLVTPIGESYNLKFAQPIT